MACLQLLLSLLLLAQGSFASETFPTPVGKFDNYVLAMSYENDFCAPREKTGECAPDNTPKGLVLHGLWPDQNNDPRNLYGYCDLSAAQVGHQWCNSDIDVKSQMTVAGFNALKAVMPGAASCLYNHEWYAHGSCSGLNVEDFFGDASILASRFRLLPTIQKLVQSLAGSTVDQATLLRALEKDLGPQVATAVKLLCRRGSDQNLYFTEIDLALDRNRFMEFPAPQSLGVIKKSQDTCPSTGILVSL